MKTILLAGLLSAATFAPALPSSAKIVTGVRLVDDTPTAVKAAITRLYPTVKNVKFGKENGDYEAEFTHNGKSMSVVLDAKGTVKETETGIAINALPTAVREYIAKHHGGHRIKEAAEIVDSQGKKTYEAEVGGKDLMFNDKGAHIN